MSGLENLPANCRVERPDVDGVKGHQFAICSDFADGLPGTAILGFVAYRPHAQMFAAAPEMLTALELALEYWAHHQQRYRNRHPRWVTEARAAIAKARGA